MNKWKRLKAVASGWSGINQDHEVPPTTLEDRISRKIIHKNSGRSRYLNEEKFAEFSKETASGGYGKDVMSIAELYARNKGVRVRGDTLWESRMTCHYKGEHMVEWMPLMMIPVAIILLH